jgi:ribonuclease HI
VAAGPHRLGVSESVDHEWILRCDGGARGNPGPAALGYVLCEPSGGEREARGEYIGHATNNVAEYRSLIAGLEAAGRAGADPLLVCMDSELVVRQMTGEYRVKNAGLKPLHAQARRVLATLGRVRFSSVRRESNVRADGLVNEALDAFLGSESPR